jgi:hypothetical protein
MLRVALILLSVFPVAIQAAPREVERFDAKTWARLQQELPRPAVVVFTATYCSNCPALIAKLAKRMSARGLKQPVVAVVIDEATPEELLTNEHYRSVGRLFSFDGDEAKLRYIVDPRWRGLTPYVALIDHRGAVTFVAGTPSDSQFDKWLKPQT